MALVKIKQPKEISLYQVIDELNDDEYEAYLDVDTYDKKANKPEKRKAVKVKRAREKLGRRGYESGEFAAIAQAFVDNGILTQARFDEIFAKLTK